MLLEYEIMVQHHDSAQKQSFYCLLDWDDMNFIWIQMEYNTSAKYSCITFRQKFIFVCQSVWILYCWLHESFIFCLRTDSQWPKPLFWFVPKTNTTSKEDCNYQANQPKVSNSSNVQIQ